jgi:hypothetical protein
MSLFNGIGDALSKICEWTPSKKESYKNEIEKLKRKLSDIQKRSPYTTNDSIEYASTAQRMRDFESKYKNI